MSKTIITEIPDKDVFLQQLLPNNPGIILIKLGADWCGPCKKIKETVHGFFAQSPPEVICADINVDKCPKFYTFLQSRKMVNGIPVLLCYIKGNNTWIPDDSITGADPIELHNFFTRCGKHLITALKNHPNK
jgi:thioredoxin-like negative regulator of GroEL